MDSVELWKRLCYNIRYVHEQTCLTGTKKGTCVYAARKEKNLGRQHIHLGKRLPAGNNHCQHPGDAALVFIAQTGLPELRADQRQRARLLKRQPGDINIVLHIHIKVTNPGNVKADLVPEHVKVKVVIVLERVALLYMLSGSIDNQPLESGNSQPPGCGEVQLFDADDGMQGVLLRHSWEILRYSMVMRPAKIVPFSSVMVR